MMKERITPYLKKISASAGIRSQYCADKEISDTDEVNYSDPLMEEKYEVVKGLVHKYHDRALIKVSYLCAAHCRSCTRIRQIGDPSGTLTHQDIDDIVLYLRDHPQIHDVILSGGDPFFTPTLTEYLLGQLQTIESIKVFRIGTRLPLQSPDSFYTQNMAFLLDRINTIQGSRPFYILLHADHPDELTPESMAAISLLKKQATSLLSQTVFLKGINDDYGTLYQLFRQLYHAGVMPYYIYHCDDVRGLEHFQADMDTEIAIMSRLRKELSGIACPTFVLDTAATNGKIPVNIL